MCAYGRKFREGLWAKEKISSPKSQGAAMRICPTLEGEEGSVSSLFGVIYVGKDSLFA